MQDRGHGPGPGQRGAGDVPDDGADFFPGEDPGSDGFKKCRALVLFAVPGVFAFGQGTAQFFLDRGIEAWRIAAAQRLRTCPVPDAHSWLARICSVADSSAESRSMTR